MMPRTPFLRRLLILLREPLRDSRAADCGRREFLRRGALAGAGLALSATLVGQYCGMVVDAAAPELGGRLIFAGEHTSENSCGYMNGAVESGERAAKEILG